MIVCKAGNSVRCNFKRLQLGVCVCDNNQIKIPTGKIACVFGVESQEYLNELTEGLSPEYQLIKKEGWAR